MADQKKRARVCPRTVRGVFPYAETVTVQGCEHVTAQGCRRILTYTGVLIRIRMRRTVLAVRGENLVCVSFSCGCATVEGKIVSVSFEPVGEGAEA